MPKGGGDKESKDIGLDDGAGSGPDTCITRLSLGSMFPCSSLFARASA